MSSPHELPIMSSSPSPPPTFDADYETDKEKGVEQAEVVTSEGQNYSTHGHVKRELKPRHLSMLALGGTIGTGLFVGAGSALATGGAVGCLLGYMVMGLAVYAMMIALGEMGTLFPDSGGFTHFSTRFLDPSIGFAVGYNFWYCYAITIPVEIVASAIVIGYWNDTIPQAAWIAPLFFLIVVINLCGVRVYGELEFWFSAIKVIAIVALIILGIVLDVGGGPNRDPIGFRYWRNPGPFNQLTGADGTVVGGKWGQFCAFWAVLVQAAFSFIGTEILSVTVGEAQNPRVAFPKAIKRTFWRILLFYVFGIAVIGLLVPSNSDRLLNSLGGDDASASPFVIAIENAGISALPSIINAVILIAAWSAGNSDLFASSRTLYALALEGKAPRIFTHCTKSGLPVYCVGVTSLFGFLSFMAVGGATTVTVFNWLYTISAITGLLTWQCILGSYLRFYYGMKRQGISRDTLPYRAPFQPYASWFGLIMVTLIVIFNGFTVFIGDSFDISVFLSAYICLPIFFFCWLGYKMFGGVGERSGPGNIFRMTKWVTLDEMDFTTGLRELDEMDAREQLAHGGKKSRMNRLFNTIF